MINDQQRCIVCGLSAGEMTLIRDDEGEVRGYVCANFIECMDHNRAQVLAAAERRGAIAALREMADDIDKGPTFPLPPSVISALVREKADAVDSSLVKGDTDGG